MVKRAALASFAVCAFAVRGAALAAAVSVPISIDAGSLPIGLQTLERQSGIELLFDSAVVKGLQAPAVKGNLDAESALRQLLADTDLTTRKAASGAWIVEPAAAAPLAQPDAVVPEVLVVGHSTENADIRRTENDVQPYVVATRAQIISAHPDNIEQYFTRRITSNTESFIPSLGQNGDSTSSIDLRGLGADGTLVLVDGRRMPDIPLSGAEFVQPDLNAIPLHAISRIEVLTGAAGGIYGFGALGGVINVVLEHNSEGLDLDVTEGITARGDAGHRAIEARFGHTSADGDTDLSVSLSHTESDPLLAGQRGFSAQDRQLNALLTGSTLQNLQQRGNSVAVFDLHGANLVFKPQFGGASLSSDHTFLSAGFSGDSAALVADLAQHTGQLDLSVGRGEQDTDLLANPRTQSLLVNVRHRFADRLEIYFDGDIFRTRGEFTDRGAAGQGELSPNSPANPFTNYVQVYFPISMTSEQISRSSETSRYTAGLLAQLPFGWRATVELGMGGVRFATSAVSTMPSSSYLSLTGDPSDLEMDPFGNWNAFQEAVTANPGYVTTNYTFHNRFQDDSLRLAGPVFTTPAGVATLTVVAEHRTETVPNTTENLVSDTGGTPIPYSSIDSWYSNATTSLYAELRTRLFGQLAPTALLRGLELQLAVRRDEQTDNFSEESVDERERAVFRGTAYTVGAKTTPWPWLMLRTSYATGQQPPPIIALTDQNSLTFSGPLLPDPKRGGTYVGEDGITLSFGGNPDLKVIRASTLSLGAVLTPLGADGPRLAVDYSHIHKSGDVLTFGLEDILNHEDYWPQRVTRGPLTEADRALGYTVGPVIALDLRDANGSALDVESLDLHAEWYLPLLGGEIRLYADATHHLVNRDEPLFQQAVESAGFLDGPLKWRANGGFDWLKDPFTVGANVQYFGRYSVLQEGPLAGENSMEVLAQGASEIPSQLYLDLHVAWHLPLRVAEHTGGLTLDLGIQNVLDKAPPRVTSYQISGPGYSLYGDPRQRRVELVLSGRF